MAGTLLVTACQPTGKTGDVIGKQPVKVENGIMTTEVLMAFGRVSGPVVSPDKSKILYGVSYENLEQNKSNRELFVMDIDNPEQRSQVDGSIRLAHALFGKYCRFYAPYYRQVTMESWMVAHEETERRYAVAHGDVVQAFDYYMTHYNARRPFILAGHSQGAKAVIELLKHTLTPRQHDNMVAAYAFGFSVCDQELEQYPMLRPACDSVDCGVLICYNSVSAPEAVSPLFRDNVICINPLNWHTDTTYAPAGQHIGANWAGAGCWAA